MGVASLAGTLAIAEQPKEKHKSDYGTTEMCYPTNCYAVREFLLLVASRKPLALHSHTRYKSSFETVLTRKVNLHTDTVSVLVICMFLVVVLSYSTYYKPTPCSELM